MALSLDTDRFVESAVAYWKIAWLETEMPGVGASPASLYYVLKQDTLFLA